MLSYCKKCGRILHNVLKLQDKCDICDSIAYEVPNEYIDNFRWRDGDGKQALIEELVKTSPEFDQYLFDHRDEILAKRSAEFNAKMAHGRAMLEEQNNVPKCPTCQSANISKISTTSKVAGAAMFGLFSKTARSQFKCSNCGYKW